MLRGEMPPQVACQRVRHRETTYARRNEGPALHELELEREHMPEAVLDRVLHGSNVQERCLSSDSTTSAGSRGAPIGVRYSSCNRVHELQTLARHRGSGAFVRARTLPNGFVQTAVGQERKLM